VLGPLRPEVNPRARGDNPGYRQAAASILVPESIPEIRQV
jgi:hypothetical protein